MKISKSVRDLFAEIEPKYKSLQEQVDKIVTAKKEPRWHYESRVKGEQSFALKLETGRVQVPSQPEDFFGATIVVENKGRIALAEELVTKLFDPVERRPPDPKVTNLQPHSFDFDDLRLYVRWKDDPTQKPTGLHGMLFEIQIKTFLQHAWGIATHDFIYKSDEIEWSTSRIAYQVKAMLENAELSIGEAKKLTASTMLDRCDDRSSELKRAIKDIKDRFAADQLPFDLRRLAQNILDVSYRLRISAEDIFKDLDEATAAGEGAKTLNLSPYAAVIAALLRKRGAGFLDKLGDHRNTRFVFIPAEIDLPALNPNVAKWLIRPTKV